MKNDRAGFFSNAAWGPNGYFPMNQMMSSGFMNDNDFENRISNLEKKVKQLENRVSRLENPYQNNNQNNYPYQTTQNNNGYNGDMYMM